MEELLASIRKAIHDDIGEVPPAMSARAPNPPLRSAVPRETLPRPEEQTLSAAAEIQQLRDKINRTRAVDALSVRDAAVSASTAQRAQPAAVSAPPAAPEPRRSWRDLDPPSVRLRPTLSEPEPLPPPRFESAPPRAEPVERSSEPLLRSEPSIPRQSAAQDPFGAHYAQPSWEEEEERPALLPPLRESSRPRPEPGPGPILSGDSAQAVQSAFNKLADTVLSRATGDRSIEELTRDLLRGMLKQWLDENLPPLVERLVREEIERVARHGR